MILPARNSFYALLSLLLLAFISSVAQLEVQYWLWWVTALAFVAVLDALPYFSRPTLEYQRHLPPAFIVGRSKQVSLTLKNTGNSHYKLQIYDHVPSTMQWEHLPQSLSIQATTTATVHYDVTPLQRGLYHFASLQIRLRSILGLWWYDYRIPLQHETRVFPDYAHIANYALLGVDKQMGQMGIIKKQRRGEGQDFLQLREYREGDNQRQIDWKATSRMQKLISREYQDERDQEILFLLDCGHRMLAKEQGLSHFDHILNAMLLVSHIALKQGDAVGFTSFAGQQRWLKPLKGAYGLQQILSQVFDLQPQSAAPDYLQVASETLVRQKKRALIILLTNLRDEDLSDLLPAMQLLQKKHLVLLVSMRESTLTQQLQQPIANLEQAVEHATTQHYLQQRQLMLRKLQGLGINALDVAPNQLSTQLINQYLDIKRSQRL